MNARSKKGALLIELALIIPMVAFVLSAGVTVLLISHRGFKTGTSEFNGSMQASILKSVLDKSIPSAGSITFETPQTGCDALFLTTAGSHMSRASAVRTKSYTLSATLKALRFALRMPARAASFIITSN